jgi:hypothetical protein
MSPLILIAYETMRFSFIRMILPAKQRNRLPE